MSDDDHSLQGGTIQESLSPTLKGEDRLLLCTLYRARKIFAAVGVPISGFQSKFLDFEKGHLTMLTIETARAVVANGGGVAALQAARDRDDFETAWIITRAVQLVPDQLVRDEVDQAAQRLFDLSEIFAGREAARVSVEDIDVDAAIEIMGLCIKRAWNDAQKDKTARAWLLEGGADALLESLGLDLDLAWYFRNLTSASPGD